MESRGEYETRRWPARALEALWLTAAVAVPLAFNPWGGNAFELPKALLLRVLVLLMGLAALAQAIASGRRVFHRPAAPLLWPALAFAAASALATAFSVSPRASLWGSYERQQGLLTLIAYPALFLLTAVSLHTRTQAERLWAALVWGSVPIVAYGLLQAAGLDPLDWRTDAASPVLSTIGRANFLGSYLVLVIPLTAGRVLATGGLPSAACLRRRAPLVLLLIAQLACLALTQARGAWVGLGVAALVFALAWAAATHSRRPALIALCLLVLVIGFVVLLNLPGGPLSSLARLPGLERLATLSHTDSGSTAARLTIWRTALPLVAARPWLSYGPETMRVVFARVFPPQLVYYQGRHVTVDRAHNLWLDLGMSTGLVGILSFAALLAGLGWLAWRALRTAEVGLVPTQGDHEGGDHKGRPHGWAALAAAVAAAIVGHLADLQFGFDLTASATVFWLVLAMASPLSSPPPDRSAVGPLPLPPISRGEGEGQGVGLGGIVPLLPPTLVTLALVYLVCLRPLLADLAYWRSQQSTRPPAERLTAAEQAVRLWPLEPEYRTGLAWAYVHAGRFAAAEVQLDAAGRLSPHDAWVWTARGEMYVRWGIALDPARYAQAEMAYRQALELAPNVATTHTSLGLVLAQQGRLEEGLAELERAVALDATDATAFRHLADLYLALGQEEKATWAQQEAERWDNQ